MGFSHSPAMTGLGGKELRCQGNPDGSNPFRWGRFGWWLLAPCGIGEGTRRVWGERGELMEKYSEAPCEVRISREGLLAAPVICMYYVKLSWQRGELPCELSKAPQWEADLELLCSLPATCTARGMPNPGGTEG